MKKIISILIIVSIICSFPLVLHASEIADTFSFPLKSGNYYLSQDFGVWNNKFGGYHLGEDYVVSDASELPVYAPAKGIVKHNSQRTSFGYVVIIEHDTEDPDTKACSVLGHLRADGIIPLGEVEEGQLIGYLSNDKSENGGYDFTHLHLGIRHGSYSTTWVYAGYGDSTVRTNWWDPSNFLSMRKEEHLSWNFCDFGDTDLGWTVQHGIAGGCQSNSWIVDPADGSDKDPAIKSPEYDTYNSIYVNPVFYNHIEIHMSSNLDNRNATLYWTTSNYPHPSDVQSQTIDLSGSPGDWGNYCFDLSNNPQWLYNGRIQWLRLDFSDIGDDRGTDVCAVDYIRFHNGSCPGETPEITSPTPGSTLSGSTQTFSWTANGASVSEWWLYVGTSLGERDIYNSGSLGSSTSTTVSGLPTDGSTLYLRLWYYIAGSWRSSDYTYTAATSGGTPEITSPAPGSTLSGSTQTFSWTANGASVSEWWLYVGTSTGSYDIYNSGSLGTATNHTVSGLPTDGSTLYVRLWYRIGSSWYSEDCTYTAATSGGTPSMTSPTPGSTLSGSTQTFNWTANGTSVSEWWLYVGTYLGGNDIHNSGSLGSSTSTNVSGLPTDGSTVYVRLWYKTGGSWLSVDAQYTAYSGGGTPGITTPAPGSTLSGSSQTFRWSANGASVAQWWLYVGTSTGANNIYDSGSLGTATSHTVSGLPTDGSTLYVRLWCRIGSSWYSEDCTYTAATSGGTPSMTSPTPGSTLSGSSQTFRWSANGASVAQWWLYVGTRTGANDIYDSGSLGTATNHTVSGLPTDGSTLYVRLWYRIGSSWYSEDCTYTAAAHVWEMTYGESGNDQGSSVQQTTDGGYIVAGKFDGTDIYLIKTYANGNQTWSNTFQGSEYGSPRSLQQTTDGGYMMAGDISTGGSSSAGIYLIKAGAGGNEEWRKTFDGDMYGGWAQQTADGGYIIAGTIWYSGSYDVLLIKTDGSGDQIWSQTFHESAYKISRCVRQTSEGGYIVTGYTANYPSDVFLIKTDTTGNEIWTTSFGGSDSDIPNSVKQTVDGGYIIVGNTLSFGAGGYDVYLHKTDADGNEQWSKTFGGSENDSGYSVEQTTDGGYIIAGSTESFGAGSSDAYLIKTDADGNEQWSKTFGGSENDSGYSVEQTTDGGYIIAGSTESFGAGSWDVYLIYYKPESADTPGITSPTPGSTLSGSTQTFNWSDNGTSVSEWWLYVGTYLGGNDIHNSGSLGSSASTNVSGLPTDGSTIHVRLWYKTGGSWLPADAQYTANSDPNQTEQKLTASDAAADHYFGGSVSISGDYAIIGAHGANSAYIFERNGGTWDQVAKLIAIDAKDGDLFGFSVSISRDYAIVGAYGNDEHSGSAYIFERNGGTWDQVAKLIAIDAAAYDFFGFSVSISGDYAIVGAHQNDDDGRNSGSAYIFERNGGTWDQVAKLKPEEFGFYQLFGSSVSINGNYATVGAVGDNEAGYSAGSAYIFERNGSTWTKVAKLIASDAAADHYFGRSVSISGDYVIIGADGAKSTYIFERSGSTWAEVDMLTGSDVTHEDRFGHSVSISGDLIIVGVVKYNYGTYSGSAYIFERNGGTWDQVAKLIASDTEPVDVFGNSVSIFGDYSIVGAYGNSDKGINSGSAYVYEIY